MRADTADYRHLFLEDIPLLDVRAPVEFSHGAFPTACNLPLLMDSEREKVGTCYQQQGQEAAISLGHSLVNGTVKAARIEGWKAFATQHPQGFLYCFRGGLRSQLVQQWLRDQGIDYPRVKGGYKALRRFLIDSLEHGLARQPAIVVAGLTGTGKTELIQALDNAIDLEQCAHHRGSSFGAHARPQPSQIDFENRVAIALLKHQQKPAQTLLLEDEGRLIGRCALPQSLLQLIRQAPIVWLEDSLAAREQRILDEYVSAMLLEYQQLYPDDPELAYNHFADYLRSSITRIRKRLGGGLCQQLLDHLEEALGEQRRNGSCHLHQQWIHLLLTHYYDPMYSYQSQQKPRQILCRGDQQTLLGFLAGLPGSISASAY
ncbi:MAG: tRNA 2-selenouridine(34) synthase MnmH [Pseudomonadales bacterium]|nr:tRNA 2-selenouridine(34) synthase MnmH [Pseudomonadales bacterium]